jgi:hypothetical protein
VAVRSCEYNDEPSDSIKDVELLEELSDCY